MNKRFQNNVIDKKVAQAITEAERLLQKESDLILNVTLKNDFKYNSGLGENVAMELLKERPPLPVFTYTPWNPWSRAIGYFDGKAMYLNLRKLPSMSIEEIAANLIHEYSHYAGFRHGSNYKTREKCLYSVPYFLSSNTGKWL
jgi:hypothetical protein